MPVVDEFLRMKNCEIKEQAMGRNELQNYPVSLSLSLSHLQELSNFVIEFTVTTLGPSHWKVPMF